MTTQVARCSEALLSKLACRQSRQSDYEYSRTLGISRSLWQAVKQGRRDIGLTLLKAIARTYPDMHQDIIEFLKDSTGEIKEDS